MGFSISDKHITAKLNSDLQRARGEQADALEKLSTGQVFTTADPRPAERAVAEGLENKLRGLASAKKSTNDAVSLLQTAQSGMQQIGNMITRMKELTVAGASSLVSDQDRRFLFLEYQALYEEVDRVAKTTEFNGLPLLDGGNTSVPEQLIFRVGDAVTGGEGGGGLDGDDDVNMIKFSGLKEVVATAEGLGLRSVADVLSGGSSESGISVEDVESLLAADDEQYASSFDESITKLADFRSTYGALEERLNRTIDYIDVYQENISAAKSKISDTDYATEIARLAESSIRTKSITALLSHANLNAELSLNLIRSAMR